MKRCPKCDYITRNDNMEVCPRCVHKEKLVHEDYYDDEEFYDLMCIEADYYEDDVLDNSYVPPKKSERTQWSQPYTTPQSNIPKCPTCQSTNIQKIGGLERGVSVAAWGLFSKKINKSFKCKNCGYTW